MNLNQIMQTVIESTLDDWNVIICWGAGSGPAFRDQFDYCSHPPESRGMILSDSHSHVAAYIPNASITLAFGLKSNDDFCEPWTKAFADEKASSSLLDVYFNNALVFRTYYVSVDGGRAKLPIPKRRDDLSIPSGYSSLIHLVDEMEGATSSFREYFDRAEFKTTNESWPVFH